MTQKINDELFERAAPGVHEKVFSLLMNEQKGKVLDAPAGPGALSRRLKNAGFDVIAVDLDSDSFKAIEVKFQRVDLNNDLPFSDGFFEYIVCVEGIEYLENPFHLLREFGRILRKGGKLILTASNALNIHSRLRYLFLGYADWLYGITLEQTPSSMDEFLHQRINPVDVAKLKYILRRNKFSIEEIFVNKSVLPYQSGIYFRPLVIPFLYLSTVLVRFVVKMFKPNDPIAKELISDEILLGEILILKLKKE